LYKQTLKNQCNSKTKIHQSLLKFNKTNLNEGKVQAKNGSKYLKLKTKKLTRTLKSLNKKFIGYLKIEKLLRTLN